MTLHKGRITFRVNYDEEIWLQLNTTEKYNTGKWVTVDVTRHFEYPYKEEGSLVVDDIPVYGSPNPPITFVKLPDFQHTEYYIGGVPPGFDLTPVKAPGADNPFLGCIKDIQIAGEARDPLEYTNHYGVSQSCKDSITKAGFYGNGFVELPSYSLKKRGNLAFVFRTLEPNGLLLLGAYPPEILEKNVEKIPGNFSVNIIDGRIKFQVDAGQGPIDLTSNLTLNDGEYHIVSVTKTGRKFELRINDEYQSSKTFPVTPFVVNLPEEKGGLFIGGAPDYQEFQDLTSLEPFSGAIKDLVFNNRSVTFDKYIGFSNVHFGRDGPTMGHFGNMMKTEPFGIVKEGCYRVSCFFF